MRRPQVVEVLGAGIAGAAAAHAFAERGARVTVIDPNGIGNGASGIPAAVVRPRLWQHSSSYVPDAEIVLQAYRWTSAWLRRHAGEHFRACGVMLCATDAGDALRLRKLATNPATDNVARFCERNEASERAGIELPNGGVFVEGGGVCDLRGLSRHLLQHERITTQTEARDEIADLRVIATGAHGTLPSQAVRGQAMAVRWPGDAAYPRTVLCTTGYLSPPTDDGISWIGSTFDRDDESTDVRTADDQLIRDRFAALPQLATALARAEVTERFVGLRRAARGRLPQVGPTDETATVASLAHGSRGAVTAPWAAHLLAATAFDDDHGIAPDLWRRLAPTR